MLLRPVAFVSLLLLSGARISAQAVIGAHSGVILFSEGSVLVDDRPVGGQIGRFSEIGSGSILRTRQGRADILLTPNAFLRLDENSSIRMVSNNLEDTRIEILTGSAMLQSGKQSTDNAVTVIFLGRQMRLTKQGSFRIDAETARLRVTAGEVEVTDGDGVATATVQEVQLLSLLSGDVSQAGAPESDALDRWAAQRSKADSNHPSMDSEGASRKKRLARVFSWRWPSPSTP